MNIDWQKTNGLIPTIVQHAETGSVLMMAFMNEESLRLTQQTKRVTFFSRSRNCLWTKGETSGNVLNFISAKEDCDGDTLLVQAIPQGPVCHTGSTTCFGDVEPSGLVFLKKLAKTIDHRFESKDIESYVAQLILQGQDKIAQKVGEEAVETVIASKNSDLVAFEGEAADLLFHLMVLLKSKGSSLDRVVSVLESRHKK